MVMRLVSQRARWQCRRSIGIGGCSARGSRRDKSKGGFCKGRESFAIVVVVVVVVVVGIRAGGGVNHSYAGRTIYYWARNSFVHF